MGSRFTGDTKDPAVNVTAWLMMVIIIFSVTTRLGTKYHLLKKLMVDDLVIFAALVFGIAQGIAVSMAVSNGYGYHYNTLTTAKVNEVMKSLYAGDLLYILSLTCSKLSLVLFIRNLSPTSRDKWLALAVEIVLGLWAAVTFFGTAFSCSFPQPWNVWNGKCFDVLTWRYFMAGSNIFTDLLLMAQAVVLIFWIQTSTKRQLMCAAIFLPRICVTIALIVQLTVIKDGTETTDPTFDLCEYTIIEGVIQCLSIVTACWGQLKPFMSWMQSNGLRITGDEATNVYTFRSSRNQLSANRDRKTYRSGKYGGGAGGSSGNRSRTGAGDDGEMGGNFKLPMRNDQILVTQEWDVNSQSSQANIIPESHMNERDSDQSHHVKAWDREDSI